MTKISKLGLGIVAFDGAEHLKNICSEIRNEVDYILVCLQNVSYFGEKIDLLTFVKYSCVLCVIAYILAGIKNAPLLNLLACGLCGLSVGILWPGIFSIATQTLPQAGTAMFALLALGGDLGCSVGPFVVGEAALLMKGSLQSGLLFGFIFPLVLIILVILYKKAQN